MSTKGIYVVPARAGMALNVPASADRALAAAKRSVNRVATMVVEEAAPARSTAVAKAMGITGVVGSFETSTAAIRTACTMWRWSRIWSTAS